MLQKVQKRYYYKLKTLNTKKMNRRKAMKIAAGVIVGSGAGIITLSNAFKPKYQPMEEPRKLGYKNEKFNWTYDPLDPAVTAELA